MDPFNSWIKEPLNIATQYLNKRVLAGQARWFRLAVDFATDVAGYGASAWIINDFR